MIRLAVELLRLLRPRQWTKNLLVFVPVLTAHRWDDIAVVSAVTQAFVVLSLTASAVYVINDRIDREDDARHPDKKHRPFASGALPTHVVWWLVPVLLLAATAVAIGLPRPAIARWPPMRCLRWPTCCG